MRRIRLETVVVAVLWLSALAASPSHAQPPPPDLSRYESGWHIVRPGENLHFITRLYLGDKQLWRQNWELNPQIEDPDVLEPGQRIKVLLERRDSVPTARLRSIAGRVEGRPRPIPWNLALELDLMLEEDGLRTGPRASTEMEFHDGTRVRMTEDSVVYLRRRGRRLVGEPPRAVEIVEGQAEVAARQPAGSERAIEILVGGARALSRPDADGVAQTRARRAADASAKVMVYEGGGEVEAGGQKVQVARGMGTSVERGRPPAPPEKLLPEPEGLEPEPGSRLTFNNLELTWQPVEGAASYTAELCRDVDCALLVERRVGLAGTSWKPRPPDPGDYYWRVTAVSASGLDGYPNSPGAALAVLGGPDLTGPTGSLAVLGRQSTYGDRLLVDETVRIEPRLEDAQSGVAGWRPLIGGAEVSPERWQGPWPDGAYQVAVRASDRAGNESLIAAEQEIVVDALPPVVDIEGKAVAVAAEPPAGDRSRCEWLRQPGNRWPRVDECRWVQKARRRWLERGWNWIEVSVDGRRWSSLIPAGSAAAREVAEARYRLPAAPEEKVMKGANAQLLVRSADGSPLLPPGGGAASAAGLRIKVEDAGVGTEKLVLRVTENEPGVLWLTAEARDAFDHHQTVSWQATASR